MEFASAIVLERRAKARVLVVGMGGLGCPIALALAHAGVGTLALADDDDVERPNLHRQILFDDADVGTKKTVAAKRALERQVPSVQVVDLGRRILPTNAVEFVTGYDLVVEGSDNFATKFLVADACRIARKPVVHSAAVRWQGTALAVSPNGAPCYRCVFEDIPVGDAPNCAEAGVMGPVVGLVGAFAADLALRVVDGHDTFGTLVTFDGLASKWRRRPVHARANCDLCGERPTIETIAVARYVPTKASAP